MFSSLLVHASPANISPFDRTIVYLSLCHVDNHIRAFNRMNGLRTILHRSCRCQIIALMNWLPRVRLLNKNSPDMN